MKRFAFTLALLAIGCESQLERNTRVENEMLARLKQTFPESRPGGKMAREPVDFDKIARGEQPPLPPAAEKVWVLTGMAEFMERWNAERRDADKLRTIQDEFQGKWVQWTGFVCKRGLDKEHPYLSLGVKAGDAVQKHVHAAFDPSKMDWKIADGAEVRVNGRLHNINVLGPILKDCEILPSAPDPPTPPGQLPTNKVRYDFTELATPPVGMTFVDKDGRNMGIGISHFDSPVGKPISPRGEPMVNQEGVKRYTPTTKEWHVHKLIDGKLEWVSCEAPKPLEEARIFPLPDDFKGGMLSIEPGKSK